MADERVTDEALAAACALSSGEVDASPSPSPTPTFSGTGRPQRRARRLRWRAGVPRSMMALSAFSLALMVAGAVGYACKAPGMLSRPAVAPLNPLGLVLAASASDGGALSTSASSAQAHAVGPVAVQDAAAQTSAADVALGLGAQGTALGVASLVTGASAVDSSFTQAVEASKANESAARTHLAHRAPRPAAPVRAAPNLAVLLRVARRPIALLLAAQATPAALRRKTPALRLRLPGLPRLRKPRSMRCWWITCRALTRMCHA